MKRKITLLPFIALVGLILLQLTSCTKDGEMGPPGPIGQTGAPGPQGPPGNAEDAGYFQPKVFDFENITIPAGVYSPGVTGGSVARDFEISKEEFEQSMVVMYVTAGTNNANWLPMPGFGNGVDGHLYRVFYSFPTATTSRAFLWRMAGPTGAAQTFLKLRIIVIPLNLATSLRAEGTDLGNLNEVTTSLQVRGIDLDNLNVVGSSLGL